MITLLTILLTLVMMGMLLLAIAMLCMGVGLIHEIIFGGKHERDD